MAITNATTLRKNLFDVLENTITTDETTIVTTKNGNVAIVSEEYLHNLEETCYLYGIPGMKDSVIKGVNTPISECVEINWKARLK